MQLRLPQMIKIIMGKIVQGNAKIGLILPLLKLNLLTRFLCSAPMPGCTNHVKTILPRPVFIWYETAVYLVLHPACNAFMAMRKWNQSFINHRNTNRQTTHERQQYRFQQTKRRGLESQVNA